MLAPPSTTFSCARDRSGAIRSAQYPWGLPNLCEQDAKKVHADNLCMRATLRIIAWLEHQRIPWILEHPYTSRAWLIPRLKSLRQQAHIQAVVTDCCQYGTPWRKRTLLLASRIDELDLSGCSRICSGNHGFCSKGHRHVQLAGHDHAGQSFSRKAQTYPHRLGHALASWSLRASNISVFFSLPAQPSCVLPFWGVLGVRAS